MFKKASLGLKVLFLSLFLWAKAFCFECRVYNVGQANLVVIKHNNNSLIIDCEKRREDIDDRIFQDSIFEFTNGTQVSLVITHQHFDHYNFLGSNREKLSEQGDFHFTLIGGLCNGDTTLFSIPNAQFCEVWEGGAIQNAEGIEVGRLDANTLQNCLGPDVRIQLLLPYESVGDQEHDQNLVLKVTYGNKSILFPGDANGKLLDNIITKDENISEDSFESTGSDLEDIEGTGSGLEELEWFRQVSERNFFLSLVIVSSDPRSRNKLPWNMVKDLPKIGSAEPHRTLFRGRLTETPGTGERENFEIMRYYDIAKALFTTYDTPLYYAITVDGGRMTMTSNDAQGNQTPFYSRGWW
jgi:hypothetical protein